MHVLLSQESDRDLRNSHEGKLPSRKERCDMTTLRKQKMDDLLDKILDHVGRLSEEEKEKKFLQLLSHFTKEKDYSAPKVLFFAEVYLGEEKGEEYVQKLIPLDVREKEAALIKTDENLSDEMKKHALKMLLGED
jgi:hypothetical protein